MKKSWIWISLLILGVLVASFMGGNWTTGYADTVPTIPGVVSVIPAVVRVGGPAVVVTIQGANFIDTTWTKVRWLGPDQQLTYLTPAFVSGDGKTLRISVPPELIQSTGTAYLWVINHLGDPLAFEVAGPLTLGIKHLIYLPVAKR